MGGSTPELFRSHPFAGLDLVELFLDCLPQFDVVDIALDEQGLDDLAEGLHRLVEAVLPGVRVQAPEDFRSRTTGAKHSASLLRPR